MSREAERLYWLRLQLADLRTMEPTIPRGPKNARRIGKTRRNIVIVEGILRELAGLIIQGVRYP